MILDIIKEAALSKLGVLKPAPKGWYKRHCMLCHTRGHGKDTRNRFGIQFNPTSIAVNCFNCGFSAGYTEGKELSKSFKFFLKQIQIDQKFIDQIDFEIFKEKNNLQEFREGASSEDKQKKLKSLLQSWNPIDLPEDSLTIGTWLEMGLDDKNFMKVLNYGLSRKIHNLENFYWSPSKKKNLQQRLIIPYFYKNNIVGFTARLCFTPDDKSIPKYYQQCPEDFVYNLDNQNEWARKYVILTEGVLDAYQVDGISVLGEIGKTKIDIINSLQKQVIVIPDGDLKGGDLVDAALENNWMVSFPKWLTRISNIKDAAAATEKYGRLLTTYSIISSAVSGKEKIKIKWNIEKNERQRRK